MKVLIKTLGCEKNMVDSENAMALLAQTGCTEAEDVRDADILIVNTCGFIHDAKQQSIETIFDLIREKRKGQKLIVTGCLSQRYAKELAEEMGVSGNACQKRITRAKLHLRKALEETGPPGTEDPLPPDSMTKERRRERP